MNKKGFTLIELLAVIIILGILMIIAIPSVTKYINDSRKSAYIDTAKEIVSGTRNLVNGGKLGMYDTNTTYYIPAKYVNTENSLKSPYGEFTDTSAYVGVIYDGKGYNYYWISSDDAGQGISEITLEDKLDVDNIKSDLNPNDILSTVETIGIGNRTEIKILNMDGTWRPIHLENVSNNTPENGNSSGNINPIVYPTGKTKDTVVTGDIVKIGTEEFYVIKHDGSDLVLLARYNLKVGNIVEKTPNHYYNVIGEYTSNDEGYGLQSVEAQAQNQSNVFYGTVRFSSTNYWAGKVGNNLDYEGSYSHPNYPYVYYDKNKQIDSHNEIAVYVESYKKALEKMGAQIKEARLLKYSEVIELGGKADGCVYSGEYQFLRETSFWLGSVYDNNYFWEVTTNGNFYANIYYSTDVYYGVRPVIII
jgi:prepilin-type N-terminal cleavage/methylation domain-containing protein